MSSIFYLVAPKIGDFGSLDQSQMKRPVRTKSSRSKKANCSGSHQVGTMRYLQGGHHKLMVLKAELCMQQGELPTASLVGMCPLSFTCA